MQFNSILNNAALGIHFEGNSIYSFYVFKSYCLHVVLNVVITVHYYPNSSECITASQSEFFIKTW